MIDLVEGTAIELGLSTMADAVRGRPRRPDVRPGLPDVDDLRPQRGRAVAQPRRAHRSGRRHSRRRRAAPGGRGVGSRRARLRSRHVRRCRTGPARRRSGRRHWAWWSCSARTATAGSCVGRTRGHPPHRWLQRGPVRVGTVHLDLTCATARVRRRGWHGCSHSGPRCAGTGPRRVVRRHRQPARTPWGSRSTSGAYH